MKKNITSKSLLVVGLLFVVGLISVLRPVPIVSEDEAIVVSGIVSSIHEGGIKDVVFKLENNSRRYYINRGLENGMILNDLKERLIGNEVIMKYPKYWTPLDWDGKVKHISKLEYNGEVLFNELK